MQVKLAGLLEYLALYTTCWRGTSRQMKLGDLIRQRRTELGLSQAELARLIGVSRAAVGQWEGDITAPTRKNMPSVAKALQLQLGVLSPYLTQSVEVVDRATLTRNVPLMAWDAFVSGDSDSPDLPRVSVGGDVPPDAIALRVCDDAMSPEISDGDLIVVSRSTTPLDNDVVIAHVDGAGILRKYSPRGVDSTGNPVFDLLSTSADYPTVTCNSRNGHKVLGTVVAHWRVRRR